MRGVKNNFLVVGVVLLLCFMPVVSAGLFDWFTGTGNVVDDLDIEESKVFLREEINQLIIRSDEKSHFSEELEELKNKVENLNEENFDEISGEIERWHYLVLIVYYSDFEKYENDKELLFSEIKEIGFVGNFKEESYRMLARNRLDKAKSFLPEEYSSEIDTFKQGFEGYNMSEMENVWFYIQKYETLAMIYFTKSKMSNYDKEYDLLIENVKKIDKNFEMEIDGMKYLPDYELAATKYRKLKRLDNLILDEYLIEYKDELVTFRDEFYNLKILKLKLDDIYLPEDVKADIGGKMAASKLVRLYYHQEINPVVEKYFLLSKINEVLGKTSDIDGFENKTLELNKLNEKVEGSTIRDDNTLLYDEFFKILKIKKTEVLLKNE